LHSYILSWSGDIPALSKVMCLSGHNAKYGCRYCYIKGSYSETARHMYYPLQSLQEYNNYNPENLPMHSHNSYILDSNECKKGNFYYYIN